jgi:hypothetical protein
MPGKSRQQRLKRISDTARAIAQKRAAAHNPIGASCVKTWLTEARARAYGGQ